MEHTVLVTGATAGFGEATARRFLAHGHKVIAVGRRAERLEALKASLPAEQQKKLLTLVVDICDSAKVDALPKTLPAGGDAYFPLSNAIFYSSVPVGSNPVKVYGLTGNPNVSTNVFPIPKIQMPNNFNLGQTYIMAEYIYLDKPEANKFRLADIKVPIVQHYPFDPVDSQNLNKINYKFSVPNPTRNLFFYLNHISLQ